MRSHVGRRTPILQGFVNDLSDLGGAMRRYEWRARKDSNL